MKTNRNTFEFFATFAALNGQTIPARDIWLKVNLNWKKHKELMHLFESYGLMKFTITTKPNERHNYPVKAHTIELTELGQRLYDNMRAAKL